MVWGWGITSLALATVPTTGFHQLVSTRVHLDEFKWLTKAIQGKEKTTSIKRGFFYVCRRRDSNPHTLANTGF